MSEERASLDLRAEIARIDRDRAETEKLIAETQKLLAETPGRIERARVETEKLISEIHNMNAESSKLGIEAAKLLAEARKLDRERWLAPTLAIVSVVGGLLGVFSFVAHLLGK